jgi:hypothetical protein
MLLNNCDFITNLQGAVTNNIGAGHGWPSWRVILLMMGSSVVGADYNDGRWVF